MTDLYLSSIGSENNADFPILPETRCLQECLQDMTWEELDVLNTQDSCRAASYRAKPEPNGPLRKFRVDVADPNLLRFVGQEASGFEVLQVFCAGFQYHWRSDLSRAFEEEVPFLSRIYGLRGSQELVVEHLVVPLIRKHRVREIRGWFAFSQDMDTSEEWASRNADSLFRRTEQAHPVRLPTQLWDPERKRIAAGLFRSVKTGWRESKDQRRP